MTTRDLSGRWDGYYLQHNEARPISARFRQDGSVLLGTMSDEVTEFETSVSEVAMLESLPPGADEQIVERIRALCPEAPLEPVRVMVHLPGDSDVRGEVRGREVRLLKRHRGQFFAGYRVGDVRIGELGEDQQMDYRGHLSTDGVEIRGLWNALGEELSPFHRGHGEFVLRRTADEGEPVDPRAN